MLWRKEREAVPTKRFRPSTAPKLGEAAVQPHATTSKVPEGPENRPPPLEKAQVYKSTPWLALEECQKTSLRTGTGCSFPTT